MQVFIKKNFSVWKKQPEHVISNEYMEGIMKIFKSLKDFSF